MSRGKAYRRAQLQRLKKKRKNDIVYHENFPINKHVTTPKLCSCIMCGNSRKYFGNGDQAKTIQELREYNLDEN